MDGCLRPIGWVRRVPVSQH